MTGRTSQLAPAALHWVLSMALAVALAGPAVRAEPSPHPQAGKFRLRHDPDKPLLAYYGGIGLYQLPDGRWTGYAVRKNEDVDYLVRRCAANGMKRVYGSFQEEQYPSAYSPPPASGSPDYIRYFIDQAHANNIEVYADQPVFAFVRAKNRQFAEQHPGFFTRNARGELDTHMLSAGYPEVRAYKRAVMMEWLANYPVDGLQLDFIRFPYYTRDLQGGGVGQHGYDQPLLDSFRSKYELPAAYLPEPAEPRWIQHKADAVTQFIREMRADMKRAGVSIPLGVFNSGIYHRWNSLRTVHQDWEGWEADRLVDEHAPMVLMTHGYANLARVMQSLLEVRRSDSVVMGPVFLAEGFETDKGDVPTPDLVRDIARRLIKMGCDGLWFCRASEIEQYDLWPVVKEISEWSISAIREEQFDPAYENLLRNGRFEAPDGWALPASARVVPSSAGNVLRVFAGKSPVELSQAARFRAIRHLAVHSLALCVTMRRDEAARLDGPVTLEARLRYHDGTQETLRREVQGLGTAPQPVEFMFPVKSDFARRVLAEAACVVRLPAGIGTVEISAVELLRDPLLRPRPLSE